MKNIYVDKTKNNGFGIFAGRNIKKSEEIFIVRGKKISAYCIPCMGWIGRRWLGIGKNMWIKPEKNNLIFYTNHSCNPNAEIKYRVKLIATKNINMGEEITFDYAQTESDPYWRMKCRCRSKNCKKIIMGEAKWQ